MRSFTPTVCLTVTALRSMWWNLAKRDSLSSVPMMWLTLSWVIAIPTHGLLLSLLRATRYCLHKYCHTSTIWHCRLRRRLRNTLISNHQKSGIMSVKKQFASLALASQQMHCPIAWDHCWPRLGDKVSIIMRSAQRMLMARTVMCKQVVWQLLWHRLSTIGDKKKRLRPVVFIVMIVNMAISRWTTIAPPTISAICPTHWPPKAHPSKSMPSPNWCTNVAWLWICNIVHGQVEQIPMMLVPR